MIPTEGFGGTQRQLTSDDVRRIVKEELQKENNNG
jgi:hypothetical protein